MFNNMGNMSKMMKQAQKIQQDIATLQEDLPNRFVEASVGGGVVEVKVSGKQQLASITLKPEIVDPEDIEMLQDLILAAINEGIKKSQEMVSEEMAKITGGLNIPGL
ncbi:MAG: YbaB/EbfC family nucleoid-associated protein [Ignavibacteriales bacterium]